jgi:hypothetical protein
MALSFVADSFVSLSLILMKMKSFVAVALAAVVGVPVDVMCCTRAVYFGKASQTVTGRSMDWVEDMQTNLWVFSPGDEAGWGAGEGVGGVDEPVWECGGVCLRGGDGGWDE